MPETKKSEVKKITVAKCNLQKAKARKKVRERYQKKMKNMTLKSKCPTTIRACKTFITNKKKAMKDRRDEKPEKRKVSDYAKCFGREMGNAKGKKGNAFAKERTKAIATCRSQFSKKQTKKKSPRRSSRLANKD